MGYRLPECPGRRAIASPEPHGLTVLLHRRVPSSKSSRSSHIRGSSPETVDMFTIAFCAETRCHRDVADPRCQAGERNRIVDSGGESLLSALGRHQQTHGVNRAGPEG